MNEYEDIIVTLYEGHYHYGVASLANSLVYAGFKGLIVVGYKGILPPWLGNLTRLDDGDYVICEDISIKFELLDVPMHFGYFKPNYLNNLLLAYPLVQRIYYFDPDIVVNCKWAFYLKWPSSGIALCMDNSYPFVHHNHPWRSTWRELFDEVKVDHQINQYVNSGFIGIRRQDTLILARWVDATNRYIALGGDVSRFEKGGYTAFKGDQDLLNAAITVSPDLEFSIIGTEGMGFTLPADVMSHAVYDIKPWKKNFLKILLKRGHKPGTADYNYLKHANYPIQVFTKKHFAVKKFSYRSASILGRIFG